MDIMEMVSKVVSSLTGDKNLLTQFIGDPTKIIKSLLGGDLSNDVIGKVLSGVKDKIGDLLGGEGLDAVANAAQGLLGGAADAAADVKDAAAGAAANVKDAVDGAAEDAKDAAEEAAGGLSGILGALKKIF